MSEEFEDILDHCRRKHHQMMIRGRLERKPPSRVKRFWQRYQGQILGATLTAMLIIGIIGFGR